MSAEADWVCLDQIAEFRSGGTPSKADPTFWSGDLPWVSAKDMKDVQLHDTEDHVSVKGLRNRSQLAPSGASLVLVRGMTLLNDVPVCVVRREMAFNQDIKALIARDGVNPEYLNYAFARRQSRITVDGRTGGTWHRQAPDGSFEIPSCSASECY